MNIVEAYIKFNEQLIIVISGMPGCNKKSYAKVICNDLHLKFIDQNEYYKKDFNNIIEVNDMKFNNIYTDDAIDWDKFNEDINKYKKDGILISGISFPQDKLSFKVDYHLHLGMTKQQCLEKRKKYINKHKDQYPEEYDFVHSDNEITRMNNYIYPYYEKVKDTSINKFINIKTHTKDEILDMVWTNVMEFIKKHVN